MCSRSFGAQLEKQSDVSDCRAVRVCSESCAQSGSQDSSVPSRPWPLLGAVPGWAGSWWVAGCPGARPKEELCYLLELLSVQVCVTRGPHQSRACHTPVLWFGEEERRHAIDMAAAKAERQRRQTGACAKQTVDRFRGSPSKERSY